MGFDRMTPTWTVGLKYQLVGLGAYELDATCAITGVPHSATGMVLARGVARPVNLKLFEKGRIGDDIELLHMQLPKTQSYEVIQYSSTGYDSFVVITADSKALFEHLAGRHTIPRDNKGCLTIRWSGEEL